MQHPIFEACRPDAAGGPSRERIAMPCISSLDTKTESLIDGGIERIIRTVVSCGLPKSDSST